MSAISKLRTNELAAILTNVALDDARQIQAASRAADLPPGPIGLAHGLDLLKMTDAELVERGWTRRELHIAIDAKCSSKEAPVYLKMLSDRTNLRWRDGDGEKVSKTARVVMPVVVVNQQARDTAPVIEVNDIEVKR